MSALPVQLIAPQSTSASLVTYYTAQPNRRVLITRLVLVNTSLTNTHAVDIHIIPTGQSAGVSNRIVQGKSLAAGETLTFPALEGLVMIAGDFLQMKNNTALSTDITIMASGVEFTT